MGMTDNQFKAYIRKLIIQVERALKASPDNEDIKKLLESLQADLEG